MINAASPPANVWQIIAEKKGKRQEGAGRENFMSEMGDCTSFMDARQQIVHVVDFHEDMRDFPALVQHCDAARGEIDIVFAANGLFKRDRKSVV